jgi:hypothetical protein
MKKFLISAAIATQLLTLSSVASASDVQTISEEPIVLSAVEMDDVTAGARRSSLASIFQINISPVIVTQISVLNFGTTWNIADILSGNLGGILQ